MTIDHVAERVEIEHVIAVYVHAMDSNDFDRLEKVFTSDAIMDFTSIGGIRANWPEVRQWWSNRHGVYVHYFHLFVNPLVVFTSDTRAEVTTKVYNPCGVIGPDGKLHDYVIHGMYDDVFVSTPEGWRIAERTWNHGWITGDYPFEHAPGKLGTESAG
jgi:hypothetical protein